MTLQGPVPGTAARAVRSQLADGRRATVLELGQATGLPRSTVVHALRRLEEAGEATRHEATSRGRGRPSHRWSLAVAPGPVAVLVAGAHGTSVGVVGTDGEVLSHAEAAPLELYDGGRRVGGSLELLDRALQEAGASAGDLSAAVVGLPGVSSFTATPGRPRPNDDRSGYLRQFRTFDRGDPTEVMARHLGCVAYSENDANLAALGEATYGTCAGLEMVLYVALAQGTGAGLVVDGRLRRGHSGLNGEIGHLHDDDDGRLCQCGARGCFWHSHSIPALLDGLTEAHGRPFETDDLVRAAGDGDHDVVRALLGFGHALGRRLADAVVFISPDAIVLDGSLGPAGVVVTDGVREAIRRYAPPSMAAGTRVVDGMHGTSAALRGAAALVSVEGLL